MKTFDYYEPQTLSEAQTLLRENNGSAKIIAGGTDLIPALKRGNLDPRILVNLKKISGLNFITYEAASGLKIGPLTTLQTLVHSPEVRENYPIIAKAAGKVASYQIRNRGTIGGNICLNNRCRFFNQSEFWHKAYPDCRKTGGNTCYVARGGEQCYALMSSDLVPALVAYGAQVKIAGADGEKVVDLERFFTGEGAGVNILRPGDIVTAVMLPPAEGLRAAFSKYNYRETVDFAMVSAAVTIGVNPAGVVYQARIVLGGVAATPLRCPDAEETLTKEAGAGIEVAAKVGAAAAKEAKLFSNVKAPVQYLKSIIGLLVTELTQELLIEKNKTALG